MKYETAGGQEIAVTVTGGRGYGLIEPGGYLGGLGLKLKVAALPNSAIACSQ